MNKLSIVLLIAVVLSCNTSCMKKQNLDDDDLGDPITQEALVSAISDGVGAYSYDIKKDEASSFVISQSVQAGTPYNLEQQDMTIKDVVRTNATLQIDSYVTKTVFSDSQNSQSSREWSQTFNLAKNSPELASAAIKPNADETGPFYLFRLLERMAFGSCMSEGEDAENCYKLQTNDIKLRVSPAIAPQHNCENVNQCYIDARRIEFDTVSEKVLDKDGKPLRIHYTMIVSKDVPFLSKMMQLCYKRLYEITNSQQKVLADTCYTVNNYAFGK